MGGSQTSESAPRAVCHSGVQTGCLSTQYDVSFVTRTDNEQETGQKVDPSYDCSLLNGYLA